MAVVKADAYGHGAVPVARAALEAGASWLGVAHISEALALRAAGIDAPLLAWLHTTESNFAAAVAAGVDIGCSGWELERIVAAAREQERPARIHLKVDTGLGRNGATLESWDQPGGRGHGVPGPGPAARGGHLLAPVRGRRTRTAGNRRAAGRLPRGAGRGRGRRRGPRGPAPRQHPGHAVPARHPLRPGPRGPGHLRPLARSKARRPPSWASARP